MSIDELFNSWINWPDSWEVVFDDFRSDSCDAVFENRSLVESREFTRVAQRAHYAVDCAITAGSLPDLEQLFVKCSDCSEAACFYDHRDYLEPLDVVPVCRRCNGLRGPADFLSPYTVRSSRLRLYRLLIEFFKNLKKLRDGRQYERRKKK